jgi:hypothetical protein
MIQVATQIVRDFDIQQLWILVLAWRLALVTHSRSTVS